MCLVGVGKCMGVEFGKIGSAPRVRGPSGTPKKARFWSSSNRGKLSPNCRQGGRLVVILGLGEVSVDLVGQE